MEWHSDWRLSAPSVRRAAESSTFRACCQVCACGRHPGAPCHSTLEFWHKSPGRTAEYGTVERGEPGALPWSPSFEPQARDCGGEQTACGNQSHAATARVERGSLPEAYATSLQRAATGGARHRFASPRPDRCLPQAAAT